jgi:hypothetical protein
MSALIEDLTEILKPNPATVTPAEADHVPPEGEAAWVGPNLAAPLGKRMLVTRDRDGALKVFEDLGNARPTPCLVDVPPSTPRPWDLKSVGSFLKLYIWP